MDTGDPIFQYLVMPLLIIIARVLDVSIGTMRIILLGKGNKLVAATLGFVEIFIWILAIGQIMQNLDNFLNYISYALGFALGTYFGMYIEGRLSLGKVILRVITNRDPVELVEHLFEKGYTLTFMEAEGRYGPVKVLFLVMKRKKLPEVIDVVRKFNPKAFYTIEEVKHVNGVVFEESKNPVFLRNFNLRHMLTKKK